MKASLEIQMFCVLVSATDKISSTQRKLKQIRTTMLLIWAIESAHFKIEYVHNCPKPTLKPYFRSQFCLYFAQICKYSFIY